MYISLTHSLSLSLFSSPAGILRRQSLRGTPLMLLSSRSLQAASPAKVVCMRH